jgi:hypothetical protein
MEVRTIFKERDAQEARSPATSSSRVDEWDSRGARRRSPDIPYVIHYDERDEMEDYQEVTLTYYDGDDVLCDERDEGHRSR